jgi:hypothetical protein
MTEQRKRDKIAKEIRALRNASPKPCYPPHREAPPGWKFWASGIIIGMLIALDPFEKTYLQVQRMLNIKEPLPKWN